jgi:ceramide kinase
VSGRYRSIMLIVTPCRSDKTPCGMARTGHLCDGRLKLVLVPDAGPLGLLRVLESMARRGLAARDPGPVAVLDACEVEVSAGGTADATLDWNLDGEPVAARKLRATMLRGALAVFASGIEQAAAS